MKKPSRCGFIDINIFSLIAFFVLTAVSSVSFAQAGFSLETEINNIERSITRQGVTAEERHVSFVKLAQLRRLSGDIEGAARNWLEAAAAIPGRVDDDALLNCAYCLAAMGEWERASAALLPLLSRYKRARFLNIVISSIHTGNIRELENLAGNPEYTDMKAETLFVLWKLTGAASWRLLLVNEFPNTPEGRLAAGANQINVSNVVISPTPFWFFLSGFDSPAFTAGGSIFESVSQEGSSSTMQITSSQSAAGTTTSTSGSVNTEGSARLQTGIFSQQVNAQNQADRLRQAGFTPAIEQRVSGSGAMWAVTVPSGASENRTIQNLRAAGFESFPLR